MIIPVGRQGENEAQRIIWPDIVTNWSKLYGDGVFSFVVKRNGDDTPYPAVVTTEDGSLVWVPTNADTANVGFGSCELVYTVGDVIAKSQTWRTEVYPSLTGEGETEPPEPYQSWVDEVIKAGAAAEAAASAAAGSEQSSADDAEAAKAAKEAALTAKSGAQAASSAAQSSAQAAENSATAAQSAASAAAQSAAQASTAAANAGASATLAESWAVGGTGTRTGEDANNAQYYATQAGDANDDAQQARTDIQDSIDGVAQEDTAQGILALVEQIAESGGGASDLNGFGLTLDQSDNSVNLTYTNPTTGEQYDPAKLPTDTTATQIAAALQALNAAT